MINYRFLNYKRYNTFQNELDQISSDSIVFIQDKCYIWARGQLYKCGGAGAGSIVDNSLVFKDNNGNIGFTIIQNGEDLILRDADGNEIRAKYALKQDLNSTSDRLSNLESSLGGISSNFNDGLSDLRDAMTALINAKQDKLTAGSGISIQKKGTNLEISSTVDAEVYVIVSQLPSADTANPNKIYLLETANGDGTYRYIQYRVRNGQWVSFDAVMPTVDLSGYLKSSDAAEIYQIKGAYLTAVDLVPYAKVSDLSEINNKFSDYVTLAYAENTYQKAGNYITQQYALDTFVKHSEVYTPDQGDTTSGETSSGDTPATPAPSSVLVDSVLSVDSSNPVQNRIITLALQEKVNRSELVDYATVSQLSAKADASALSNYVQQEYVDSIADTKQDKLTPGRGIEITDNVISTNLDTDVFVIVSRLPEQNISENKIYLVETYDDNTGEYSYAEYRYADGDWRLVGNREATIDLSDYYTKSQADGRYQPAGRYLTTDVAALSYQPAGDYATNESMVSLRGMIANTYQPKGDYALTTTLNVFRDIVEATYQKKGEYVLASEVADKLIALQRVIDQKYVLKKDVYKPGQDTGWSTAEITPIPVNSYSGSAGTGGGSSSGGSGGGSSVMVTLTTTQYQSLVDAGQVQDDVYYFTYEESEDWTFGDPFPITLS